MLEVKTYVPIYEAEVPEEVHKQLQEIQSREVSINTYEEKGFEKAARWLDEAVDNYDHETVNYSISLLQ